MDFQSGFFDHCRCGRRGGVLIALDESGWTDSAS